MYKKYFTTFLFVLIVVGLLFTAKKVNASHTMALDLTYECLGEDEYQFKLNFYQDCAGTDNSDIIIERNWPSILLSSESCNTLIELDLKWIKDEAPKYDTIYSAAGQMMDLIPVYEVSAICDEVKSTCEEDGIYQGVEKFVFGAKYVLPEKCNDWKISYSSCCRNDAASNLVTPVLDELYVEALVNNTNGICNNSPKFTSLPVPYLCTGQLNFYNHGAIDVDGNNLKFTLINPLKKGGAPVELELGYSPDKPVRTLNDDFIFNSQTGQMSFTPRFKEVDVVTVLVEEFNTSGTLIGSVIRDIQVVILDCDNKQSVLENSITNFDTASATLINENTIEVCPGNTISFELNANDPDALDTLKFETNLSNAIPGATFTTTGINPVKGTFNWQPTEDDIGLNPFTVTLKDNVCPIPSNQIFGFNIFVVKGASAGEDKTKCTNEPITLVATGGTQFIWASDKDMAKEYQSANGDTLLVNPNETTTYFVESNLSNNCIFKDTVIVKVIEDLEYKITPPQNVCKFQPVQLSIELNPDDGPFTYFWEPTESVTQNNIANPVVVPQNTAEYKVTATLGLGCTITDKVLVTVTGNIPDFELLASQDTVCAGSPVNLMLKEDDSNCSDCVVGIGNSMTTDATPFNLGWQDNKVQMLYKASELSAAGVLPGDISKLGLEVVTKYSNASINNFQIAVGKTNAENLNAAIGFLTNVSPVFGPTTYTTVTGENLFTLDAPFSWDGTSNILVDICFDNDVDNFPDIVRSTITSFVSVLRAFASSNGCNLAVNDEFMDRPDMHFVQEKNNSLSLAEIIWTDPLASHASGATATVQPNQTTSYQVKVDVNGCMVSDSITVQTHPLPVVSLGPDVGFFAGETVQLNATGDFTSFNWLTSEGLSDLNSTNPIYNLAKDAVHIIEVSNTYNCFNSDTIKLNFGGCKGIEMASAFSPNSDGINDELKPVLLDELIQFLSLKIFNRYGQIVFFSEDINTIWSGEYKGKSQEIGVYSYVINYACQNESQQKKGSITLIR